MPRFGLKKKKHDYWKPCANSLRTTQNHSPVQLATVLQTHHPLRHRPNLQPKLSNHHWLQQNKKGSSVEKNMNFPPQNKTRDNLTLHTSELYFFFFFFFFFFFPFLIRNKAQQLIFSVLRLLPVSNSCRERWSVRKTCAKAHHSPKKQAKKKKQTKRKETSHTSNASSSSSACAETVVSFDIVSQKTNKPLAKFILNREIKKTLQLLSNIFFSLQDAHVGDFCFSLFLLLF